MTNDQSTILVVDDIKENLRLLTGMLSEHGYRVRPALDGQSALMGAFTEPPDLILLDIMMPNLNGYAVCEQLKADSRTQDIPVIFISALNEVFDKVKAFSAGGVDYITKPFQLEEVLARVQTHLALRQLQLDLIKKNEQLTQTLAELKTTQTQLIETEKMAALGKLVAGVAHEINTPIGTGITVASTLEHETQEFEQAVAQGQLKKSVLMGYLSKAKRSSQLLMSNLQRAGDLIQSFKQVAVDQTHLEQRVFLVKPYIEETLLSLTPQLRRTSHQVTVCGDDTITLNSCPGALSQIVTNLVMNSLTHAYQPEEQGQLRFEVEQHEHNVMICYTDDGCGIQPEHLDHIFEPFFTTARSRGGSGLGLAIIYNLVTQKLQGTIRCESTPGSGTQFMIEVPV